MYNASDRAPRKRTLKERLNNSSSGKLYMRLPDAARTLFDILKSNDVLLQLIGRYGGCTVRIPAKWPPNGKSANYKGHSLRRVLTPSQMLKVVGHYGGTDLYIPRCTKYIQELRNIAIIKTFSREVKQGKSTTNIVQMLARRYRLSDRHIWNILKCHVIENL